MNDLGDFGGLGGMTPQVKRLAVASLISWGGAIVAGRLLAYTYRYLLVDFKG